MNSELTVEKLLEHFEHDIVTAQYGDPAVVVNVALECETCSEILADGDVVIKKELKVQYEL